MSYATTVLADTPLRYYRLGELSGTVAHDLGSQAQNGTITGGVTPGQSGLLAGDTDTAMLFDGSSGYISLPTTGLPTGAAAWSIECWVRYSSLPGAGHYPMILALGTAANKQGAAFYYDGDVANQLALGIQGYADLMALAPMQVNMNYHLVGTYDGTTERFYLNGQLQASQAAAVNLAYGAASIARYVDGTAYGVGTIDEVAFYSAALSPAQVSNHYIAGSAQYLSATWVTRDKTAKWITRDKQAIWKTRG